MGCLFYLVISSVDRLTKKWVSELWDGNKNTTYLFTGELRALIMLPCFNQKNNVYLYNNGTLFFCFLTSFDFVPKKFKSRAIPIFFFYTISDHVVSEHLNVYKLCISYSHPYLIPTVLAIKAVFYI